MKKPYQHPDVEFDLFEIEDILTASGLGEGDGAVDNLDDETPVDPWS